MDRTRIICSLASQTLLGLAACDGGVPDGLLVGQLESDRVALSAEVNEPILAKHVVEGQAVAAGQLLMEQDTGRVSLAVAEAEAALAQSRARLDELLRGPRGEQIAAARANVAAAEHEREFRRARFQRAEELFERELASPDDRDQARAALDAALASLDLQRARLEELLTGTTVEELRQAEQELKQREARLRALELDRERHSLTAPAAGIVDSILFEPGERPAPGQPVLVLLTGEQPYARVYVKEGIRAAVGPGTAAVVRIDGIGRSFAGRVRWVASEAAFTPYFALTEYDRGHLSYLAKVDILDADRRLPDGVPVEVELDIGAGSAE